MNIYISLPFHPPAPSSYEECLLFGKVSIKDKEDPDHTVGQLVFTPLYAFFSPITAGLSTSTSTSGTPGATTLKKP